MSDLERTKLKEEQHKLMQMRDQLEAIQTQRSHNLECYSCLERKMQSLDEKADKIRWELEGGAND